MKTEHEEIEMNQEVTREDSVIPVNTKGTIVAVFTDAYYVEFCDLPDNPVVLIYDNEVKYE